jgi:uncharacterized protein (TIGR03435 family)
MRQFHTFSVRTIGALVVSAAIAFAQNAPSPAFDVASVKPAAPQGEGRMFVSVRGGPGTQDPGQMTWTNMSLMMLLTSAYDVKNFQVTGPDWLNSERFDISAKLPTGTTKDQSRVMLQNLLAERFHLTLHRESKEVQGYELVVGKNGSKLKESSPADAAADAGPPGPPGPPKRDANGFPLLERPGMVAMVQAGPKGAVARLAAKGQPLSELMRMLGNQISRPVVDKTGLTGKYDFTLEYAPDMSAMGPMPPSAAGGQPPPEGGDDSAPNMLTAVQEQLGLKLDAKKIQVDILIIDKIDKVPTEN